MIKIIDELLSSEISEAKNSVGKTARFSLSGKQAVAVGDTIVIVQKQGTVEKYFPLLVSSSEYKSKEGITAIEGRDLISQIFDCMIPDMVDQAGEASATLKAVLTEANTRGYINVYLNDNNISTTSMFYTKVNVSKRKLGELFQDICQDTGYIMWVGYDELNDKQNAFFLKPESDFVQLHTALKEGVNIVSEDLKQSSIDDVRNFIILYYYPTREPFDEAWTEWSPTNGQNRKLWYAKNTEIAKPWFASRETRIRQNGPFCYLTADALPNDTFLTVNSTADFDDSGMLYLLGGDLSYSSKDATHFYLYDALVGGIRAANSFIYQKDLTNLHTEFASFCVPVWGGKAITKVGVYVNSKVGTPGTLKLRVVGWEKDSGYAKVLYTYNLPSVQGWNYIDTNIKISDAGYEENPEHWLFWEFFISFDEVKTDANYYTLSMGQCLSLTNYLNEGEFWYWRAVGMPSIWGDMDNQANSDPSKMLSVYMESSYRAITEVWTGSGVVVGDNVWYNPWSSMHGYIHYLQKEGEGCIRAVGSGTFYKLITISLANFDRIHFWRRNDITKIKLYCGGGTYEKAFTSNADWIEESLKFIDMVKVGTPNSTLSKIEFTVAGNGLIDSAYFLYPDSGLTIYVKDDVSIGQYKQKPLVIYAKGVTESSYATSLANKILADKKDLKWSGRIRVYDRLFDYVPGKSIRVIVDSKNLDEVFAIYGITHYLDGTAELEVGSFYFDYEKFLSELQSHIENLQIAIGSAQGASTGGGSSGVYSNHAIKHQVGGSDEINITGLDGQAADNQKSDWSLLSSKPTSPVADIDDAVTKRHTHANKAQLDLVTDGDHDVRTDNPHQTNDANLVVSDVTNNNVSISKHGFMPKAPNDLTKIFKGDGTWSTLLRQELYNMLRGTTRFVYYPLITYDKIETYVYGTGACPQDFDMARVYTGATAGSCARQNINAQTINFVNSGSWGNFYVYTSSLTADSLAFVGSAANKFTEAQNSKTYIGHHAGFFYEDGQWYISCGNGTAQTTSPVTISAGAHGFEIRRTISGLEFYVDKTLLGTLTTNLPSSACYQQWFVHNKASTNNNLLYFYGFIFGAVMTS